MGIITAVGGCRAAYDGRQERDRIPATDPARCWEGMVTPPVRTHWTVLDERIRHRSTGIVVRRVLLVHVRSCHGIREPTEYVALVVTRMAAFVAIDVLRTRDYPVFVLAYVTEGVFKTPPVKSHDLLTGILQCVS